MVKGSIATRRKGSILKLVPALMLLAGLSLTAQHASAQTTYNVNTRADTHNTGGTSCSDLNGRCSLRAAVEAADTLAAGSVAYINVPAGHYVLTLNLSLILNGNNTVFITGAGSARTIVDGNCGLFAIVPGGFSVFQNGTTLGFPDPTDADNLTMSDLEITNGCADNGGAILNGGNMSLIRVHITRNAANLDGGGVNLSNDFFPTTITDSKWVSDLVCRRMQTDAAGNGSNAEAARQLLAIMDRELAKNATMTTPYGVTLRTIYKALVRKGRHPSSERFREVRHVSDEVTSGVHSRSRG